MGRDDNTHVVLFDGVGGYLFALSDWHDYDKCQKRHSWSNQYFTWLGGLGDF